MAIFNQHSVHAAFMKTPQAVTQYVADTAAVPVRTETLPAGVWNKRANFIFPHMIDSIHGDL